MTEHVRILHVEDSDRDAELVREVLLAEGLDCEIVRVETREQYIAALETGQFDLIVCDYTLPSFEGGEALEIAAAKWPHVPFLFVSGTIGEEKAVEALKRGAAEYVLKQNLARLPSAVLRALSEAKERAERRKAEEALRASEQRTRALMENAKDAILVTNIQGIVVEVNRAGEELFGRPRAEFAGCHFFDLLVADEREKARLRFEAILAGGAPGGQETIAMAADGRAVPIEISGSLVEIGGERLMLAIVRDVSERKQLEEQFRQAQKMEAVGRLAGGVAHDFNNLLTVILGYSDVINNQLAAEHPLRQEVEQIRKAGERAAALTQQLLAFSRTQVLLPQVIDIREVVTDIHTMLRRVIGEDIDLLMVCDRETSRIKADRGQLEQVLMNLAVNARDAMPGGGKLTIETRNVVFGEADAREQATAQPGSYVMIAVSDTGSGMNAETKTHIFEPFFTTKEKGKGTGLGLATVYGIVKQSGGFIGVSSEPGHGTAFRIYLPRVEEELDSIPRPLPTASESARGTETLLLLEDEEGVRRLAREVLVSHGYKVIEISGWQSALELAARHPGPIDMVLADAVMPETGGPEIVSRLSALRPGIKILSMSGGADDAVLRRSLTEAGVGVLQKPFAYDDLARRVRQLLDAS
jgi:two-component system cell cycle sensor histidine kinase/response regulator CckA